MENTKNTNLRSKFFALAIPIVVICFISQYIYPALPTDQLNFVFPYFAVNYGWDPNAMATPLTIGRIFCIPFTFICGTIIARKGHRWIFSICIILLGICEMILGNATNFTVFCIAMFIIPILSAALLMGAFAVINAWFSKWRGRVLGIITLSSPLSSLITFNILSGGEKSIGFKSTVIVFSICIIVVGILAMLLIREKPEDIGCYPDGALVPAEVIEREDANLVSEIKIKHIIRHKEIWLHAFAFGAMIFVIGACCSFFNQTFTTQGYTEGQINGLLIGFSILGMALSAFSGLIDDKFGTWKSSMMICIIFLIGMFGFRFGSADRVWLTWIGMVALGGLVGATPNLNPSMIAYVYGRDAFNDVNRVSNAITYILPSFSVIYMTAMTSIGGINLAYNGLIIVAALVLIAMIFLRKKIDLTVDVARDKAKENKD